MAETEVGVPYHLDEILDALQEAVLCFSVIGPNGDVHGWLTTIRGCTKIEVPEGHLFDIYGGDQLMLRVETLQEAKAFLLGNLMGVTGSDVQEMKATASTLTEIDPHVRAIELHKAVCPIWNDRLAAGDTSR